MTHQWTGQEATALRKHLRLTVDRFADRLGVAPRTVANWAARPDMVPRYAVWDMLDDLVRQSGPEVRARFGYQQGPSPSELATITAALRALSDRLERLEQRVTGLNGRRHHIQGRPVRQAVRS